MARYINTVTGVQVSVSDDKVLTDVWELVEEKPKSTKKTGSKSE